MEIIHFIEQWAYPFMSLVLFIFCLIKLKSANGIYFIIGFGIELLNSIIWRIPIILKSEVLSNFYQIYGGVGLFLSIISYTYLTVGVVKIGKQIQSIAKHPCLSLKNFGNFMVYFILLVIGIIFYIIGMAGLINTQNSSYNTDRNLVLIFLIIGLIVIIIAQILFLIMLHRVWKFTIDESKRLDLTPTIKTPGQAIGYLFIPFYNFYWVFLSYGKISKDINAIAKAKNIAIHQSGALGNTIGILCLISLIPYVGYFTSLIALILFPIFIYELVKSCASLDIANNITENG